MTSTPALRLPNDANLSNFVGMSSRHAYGRQLWDDRMIASAVGTSFNLPMLRDCSLNLAPNCSASLAPAHELGPAGLKPCPASHRRCRVHKNTLKIFKSQIEAAFEQWYSYGPAAFIARRPHTASGLYLSPTRGSKGVPPGPQPLPQGPPCTIEDGEKTKVRQLGTRGHKRG
eukprot:1159585-Pelagomonas_calceolata.AAC.9